MPRPTTMNLSEAVAISAASLWAHKLRGVLALIGVVIGVAAVIDMVSLINGAKRANILSQFLIEAVTLSAVEGVIGVIFRAALSLLMNYGFKVPAVLSVFWIVTALILCAMIGVVFGVYPTWKAARLDPVDALRYE